VRVNCVGLAQVKVKENDRPDDITQITNLLTSRVYPLVLVVENAI
jgi:hypothetical protein